MTRKSPNKELAEKIAAELDIDLFALEEEWVQQPTRFFMAGARLAAQRERLDALKSALAVTKADADKEIRDDPERFGLAKITEAAVAHAIANHDEVHGMERKLRDQQYRVHLTAAAVDAYDHRKRALENLVKLHGMDYFAEPRASQDAEFVERVNRPKGVKPRKRRSE